MHNKRFWSIVLSNVTIRINDLRIKAEQESNGTLASGNYYRNELAKALETQAKAFQKS